METRELNSRRKSPPAFFRIDLTRHAPHTPSINFPGDSNSATGEPDSDAPWAAAQRAEQWAGELRINLIRLVALAAFYGHHLVNYYVRGLDITTQYHLIVTAIAVAWTAAALALHLRLVRRLNPPYLKYAAVACDALMTTTLLIFSGGPKSPFLVLLLLIIAMASLRLQLRLVWVAFLLAILSYAFVCGHSMWVRPEWRLPVRDHVIHLLALGAAGLLAGQAVRQCRRLARDYASRLKSIAEFAATASPEEEKGEAP